MNYINKYILMVNIFFIAINSNAQIRIPDQSKDYPLYTIIDTTGISFAEMMMLSDTAFLTQLKPFIMENDPWANYLYGRCLFNMVGKDKVFYDIGISDTLHMPVDSIKNILLTESIKYLDKAANQKVNYAHLLLMNIYLDEDYGFLNYNLALKHIHAVAKYGQPYYQSQAYEFLIDIYLPKDEETGVNPSFPIVEYDVDKGLQYMVEAAQHKEYINYLGLAETHKEYGRYDEAVEFYLKTENVNHRFKAAKALILGGFSNNQLVTPNKERGVSIIKSIIETKNFRKVALYTHAFNNIYHHSCKYPITYNDKGEKECVKALTIDDLGKYYTEK